MEEADLSIRRGCGADLAAYKRGLRRTFDPRGRGTRTELAMVFVLPLLVAAIPAMLFRLMLAPQWWGWIGAVAWLLALLPLSAAAARRFHDQAKSGWLGLPMLLACLLALWDAWMDLQAGPFRSHDLFGDRRGVEIVTTLLGLLYLYALFQPAVDEDNPYGPNPRPPEKRL